MAIGPQRFGSSGQGPQPFGLFGGGTPFAPVPPLVSRYFNFFDGVQEYVQLAQPVTLGGSFEISVLIYPTADRAHILADNRSGNTDRLFFEEVSNKIEIFVAGTAVSFSGRPPANQLSLLTLSRDASNNYTCVLNGVSLNITAGQGAGGSFSFNSIGGQFGGVTGVPPFAGIEANVRITDNGTLIHDWAIDDNSNVIADSVGSNDGTLVNPSGGWGLFDKQSDGDWLGQDRGFTPSLIGSGWSDDGAGVYSYDGTNAFNRITDDGSLGSIGSESKVTFDAVVVSGTVLVRDALAGTVDYITANSTGSFQGVVSAESGNSLTFGAGFSGGMRFSGSISNITNRQLLRVA